MNKIPFTSQNPYAFYAKTIDSYDTETNTGKAKRKEKQRKESFKKRTFLFPPVCKWETPVQVTYSILHEYMRLPNHCFDTKGIQAPLLCLFFAVRLCSHATLSRASATARALWDTDTNALDTQKCKWKKKEKENLDSPGEFKLIYILRL